MLNLKSFLTLETKSLFIKSVCYGIATGSLNLLLIIIITHVDNSIKLHGYFLYLLEFFIFVLLYIAANYLSLDASAKLTNKVILGLRLRIQKYILESDYSIIEKMGNDALYAINNDDISKIEKYSEVLPRIIINVCTILIILGYMLYLDAIETMIFIGIAGITFFVFSLLEKKLRSQHAQSRKFMDKVTGNVHSLIEGIRELKVNAKMRQSFFENDSLPVLSQYHNEQIVTSKYDQITISWFWSSFYVILAIIVCVLQDQDIDQKMRYILPLLMIFGPLTFIIGSISTIYAAKTAINKIHGLEIITPSQTNHTYDQFESIKFSKIHYTYLNKSDEVGFKVGPISLEIKPGKVIFIVGGNGSGKSTLIKLLTGLYAPNSGEIILNNKNINYKETTKDYQAHLGVIYQTPHIFSQVLTVEIEKKKKEFLEYTELLELKNKVVLENNIFTNLEILSYGQKKRLGLLIALLEDKPIYIFDEWAADQDPHFRKIFYLNILPSLRNRGKAIIAVTHDDEYFDQADEIIKLREGQQIEV